jgi:hypothetical protein
MQSMRPQILMLALVGVLVCASAAVAKDRPRPPKPKPPPPPPASVCHSRVTLILRGTFVSAGRTSFRMSVRSSYGRRLRGRQEIAVNAETRFSRNGIRSTLAALRANDRLLVYARGCKRSAKAKRHELLARNVFAHGPAAPQDSEPSPKKAPRRPSGAIIDL